MSTSELEREGERLARRQHGVMHRDQLLGIGWTRSMIGHRLRTKEWLRVAPSVYAAASQPSTWQRQYKAAELATPGSGIAQLAAGKLHSWDGFNTVKPEVVSTHTANHRNRLAIVHRAADVRFTTVNGIRVTTQAQTLCDLLTRIRLDRWEQTADRLLLTGKMSIAELDERRGAYELSRKPGIAPEGSGRGAFVGGVDTSGERARDAAPNGGWSRRRLPTGDMAGARSVGFEPARRWARQ